MLPPLQSLQMPPPYWIPDLERLWNQLTPITIFNVKNYICAE